MANKKNYEELARNIILYVGGKENINSFRHCITRVRFRLRDESIAKDDKLNDMDGIISVVKSGGEYMLVIGNEVKDVYDAICKELGESNLKISEDVEETKKQNPVMKVLNIIMGAVMPALNLICAGGVLKGILALAGMIGLSSQSGVYILLNAMGDAVFYFLPLFLGYNMAKNRGEDGLLGLLIGAILVYPTINGVDINLFGYVVNATYTSSFLPVILIVALAVPIARFLRKRLPAVVSGFLVPTITLLIVVPLGFAFVGPFANFVGEGMNTLIMSLMNVSSILGGVVFAGLYQVMVLFGVHSALTSFSFMNVLSGNPDPIMALGCYCSFAQIGVVLAVYLKTKDKKLKGIALPAFISGIFGVTEPAIYGVTLPRIKMFVISCIGAAIGGAYIMANGILMYQFTGLGIVTFLGMLNPQATNLVPVILSAVIPFAASFVMAFIVYKEDKVEETEKEIDGNLVIESPVPGKVIPLSEVCDETFASGMLGKGFAVEPEEEGKVYAPFDGTCEMIFDTLHAVALKSNTGVQLLIHVGINTVNLEGKPFTAHVKNGDSIKKGQLLLEFDKKMIQDAGLSCQTPVIVANEAELTEVTVQDDKIYVKDEVN